IPVIDLRQKFGMERADNTDETCIIVVDLDGLLMGIVVDKVSEVLDIQEQDIEETPTFGVSVDTEFIMGIGKAKGKIVIVLDIRRVLTAEEIKIISKTEKETGTK
ncbi:MAG TPA: chemotaxis protein CheW, partial [bacterium]|nr:chemotaxis protein CheW [bacterium]